jgi:hypothetical protein
LKHLKEESFRIYEGDMNNNHIVVVTKKLSSNGKMAVSITSAPTAHAGGDMDMEERYQGSSLPHVIYKGPDGEMALF